MSATGRPRRLGAEAPVRVLHVISKLGSGGVERVLLNFQEQLAEHGRVVFDYLVHGPEEGVSEKQAEAMGSRVIHVTPRRSSLYRNCAEQWGAMKSGHYDVVHSHLGFANAPTLIMATLLGIPVRISHGHGGHRRGEVKILVGTYFTRLANRITGAHRFACSESAGQELHGTKWKAGQSKDFLMRNAFDLRPFVYHHASRAAVREGFGLGDQLVLIHVGRLSPEKNHEFSLRVLKSLNADSPPSRSRMWICGEGPLEDDLRVAATRLGVIDDVSFLGYRRDVPDLLQAADVLLLPSASEGLGLVVIEAQVTGLAVLASTGVPLETRLTDLVAFLELAEHTQWAGYIRHLARSRRESRAEEVAGAGYDVREAANAYEAYLYAAMGCRLGSS